MNYSISSENSHELLRRWGLNAKRSQVANYKAANYFSRLHIKFGIPVIVLSSIVGTSIFASLELDVSVIIRIFLGFISVVSAVLAGLQTFLNYGDRSSKHRLVASEYGAVKRHIQELLTKDSISDQDISSIRERMDMLSKESPEVPDQFHADAHEKVPELHELKVPQASSPNGMQ